MTGTGGKRAGTRRGDKPKTGFRPMALFFTFGVTLSVIAWGYLVYLAIVHGQEIRAGDESAWKSVAASGLGAVFCLFVGFMLVARLFRLLGRTPPTAGNSKPPASPAVPGRRIRSEDT